MILKKLKPDERKEAIKSIGIIVDGKYLKKDNDDLFNSLPKSFKKKLVRLALKEAAIYPDEPVTGDVHRLIRLPGSLHGGSGLRVMVLDSKKLETFNPMKDPIAFGEEPV